VVKVRTEGWRSLDEAPEHCGLTDDASDSAPSGRLVEAKCLGRISGAGETFGEHHRVLQGLAASLAEMGPHGMGGVAHDGDRTMDRPRSLRSIVDVVSEDVSGIGGRQNLRDRGVPVVKLVA
jgi:hypothetical protein